MSSEARLYFVVTVKGDLGPFSKPELREQLRGHAIAPADRVRNAFGRPLGSVAEVLGVSTQLAPATPPPAPRREARPAGAPWPIIGVAAGIVLAIALLWALGGSDAPATPPPPTSRPAAPAAQPAAAPAAAPRRVQDNGLPVGYALLDLGGAHPPGTAAANDRGTIVLAGGGADVWGERDECAFLHRPLAGDATLTVELRAMEDTDGWDKAGLMLRASTDAGAPHVSILAIHSGLVQFLTRQGQGQSTGADTLQLDGFPIWLRLERVGSAVVGSVSRDGATWRRVGRSQVAALAGRAVAGLAVCSHNRTVLNRAEFAGLDVAEPAR